MNVAVYWRKATAASIATDRAIRTRILARLLLPESANTLGGNMEIIGEWIGEIISFVVGAGAGSLITYSVVSSKADRGGTAASQSGDGTQQAGNKVGGDMAGRDIRKKQ